MSLQISSLQKAEMETLKHLWHPFIGMEFLSSVIFIDSLYPSTFLCEDYKRVFFSFRDFTGTKVVSMFVSPVSGLEFSLLISCFPVVLFWYWTAGIRLLVALSMTHHCFRCCILIYFIENSLGVWFFFSIAALTGKRSLVLMPESSAEEITVCPGKQPTMILLTFWSLAIFVPINLSDFSIPLPRGLCVIEVCMYHHTYTYTYTYCFFLWTLALILNLFPKIFEFWN